MYFQDQFRYKSKLKSLDIKLKKISKQLMAVLIIMLVLMLLKYTKGGFVDSANESIKNVFYSDFTTSAKEYVNVYYPKITDYFKGIQKNKAEDDFVFSFLPVEGEITSEFGKRKHPTTGEETNHTGIDLDAAEGTEVKAVYSGVVKMVQEDNTLGLMVVIDHENGYQTKYAHLSKINVGEGKKVNNGDIIALTGNTGVTTGPHLHFELLYNDEPINPLEFLKTQSK